MRYFFYMGKCKFCKGTLPEKRMSNFYCNKCLSIPISQRNPQYKPGDYIKFGRDKNRELVRIRDKHTCQSCKKLWLLGSRRFDVHHLNGLCGKKSKKYDKKNELDNLVTLCHKCHFNHPDHSSKKLIGIKITLRNIR